MKSNTSREVDGTFDKILVLCLFLVLYWVRSWYYVGWNSILEKRRGIQYRIVVRPAEILTFLRTSQMNDP